MKKQKEGKRPAERLEQVPTGPAPVDEIAVTEMDLTKMDKVELIKLVKEKENMLDQLVKQHESDREIYRDRINQLQRNLNNTNVVVDNLQGLHVNRLKLIRDFIDIELTDLRKGVQTND